MKTLLQSLAIMILFWVIILLAFWIGSGLKPIPSWDENARVALTFILIVTAALSLFYDKLDQGS